MLELILWSGVCLGGAIFGVNALRLGGLAWEFREHMLEHHLARWEEEDRRLTIRQRLNWNHEFFFKSDYDYGDPRIRELKHKMVTTFSRGVYVMVALSIWFIVVGMVIPALGSR